MYFEHESQRIPLVRPPRYRLVFWNFSFLVSSGGGVSPKQFWTVNKTSLSKKKKQAEGPFGAYIVEMPHRVMGGAFRSSPTQRKKCKRLLVGGQTGFRRKCGIGREFSRIQKDVWSSLKPADQMWGQSRGSKPLTKPITHAEHSVFTRKQFCLPLAVLGFTV